MDFFHAKVTEAGVTSLINQANAGQLSPLAMAINAKSLFNTHWLITKGADQMMYSKHTVLIESVISMKKSMGQLQIDKGALLLLL